MAEARQHRDVRREDVRPRRVDQLAAPVRRDPAVLDVDPLELLLVVGRSRDDRDVETAWAKLPALTVVAAVQPLPVRAHRAGDQLPTRAVAAKVEARLSL